ncbi:MAG TPA: hypothetical protein DCR04_10475 [Flavobacteriales bacterium]|nr:hypothetical protein [Flavobacteriales bacterium]
MVEQDGLNKDEPRSESGRKKRKIRIKYRERVRIEERPKGSKLSRYWKKKRKDILIGTLMISLLGMTVFMVAKLSKHRVEMNKLEKDAKSKIKY